LTRSGRPWLIAMALLAVAAGFAVVLSNPSPSSGSGSSGITDNHFPTAISTLKRQTISQQTSVPATLGYAGSYSPVNQASGTYTALPAVGQVVSDGQVLYRINGNPVVFLDGAVPAYRALSEGASGTDVTELNADLVALGYVTASELGPTSDAFRWWTKVGVERLQTALGVTPSGALGLGQMVFLPSKVRVTSVSAQLGGPAQAGQPVLQGTSTIREVTIDLDAGEQSEVKVDDPVAITLPDSSTTAGVISSVGTVATIPSPGSSSSGAGTTPTVTVEVTPTDPGATGNFDQAPVQVAITNATAPNALVAPVNALVALAGGGYAIEVVDPSGVHHLVDVSLGLFDDAEALVQVSGAGLDAGERLVVPSP
jgi:hypothetical protein